MRLVDKFFDSCGHFDWLSGLEEKKKTESLFFMSEEICCKQLIVELFPLDKIENERRHYRPGDKGMLWRPAIVRYFFSPGQGDFDDEAGNPFEQDSNGSHLRKNGRMFVAPDFRLVKDVKILFGSGVGSFGG